MIGSPLEILIFFLAVLFLFTLPGTYLILKTKLNFPFWERIFLGTSIGLVLFTLCSYITIVLNLYYFAALPIIVLDIFALRQVKKLTQGFSLNLNKNMVMALIIFIIGIVGQLAVISPSGILENNNLVFWSSHGHDASWHIALMEEFKKGYPLQNPVFAGERLVNYHFFSDIAPSLFESYFFISPWDLYFRLFPFLYSIELGATAFILGKKLGKSFQSGLWTTIFTYFCGSFGYVITLLKDHQLAGESIFGSSQIQSSIGNPPQVVSLFLVLTFLYFFSFFVKNKNKTLTFICLILAGTLIVFKVYAGVVVLGGLGAAAIWQIIKEKKLHILSLFIPSLFLSSILYFPNVSGTTSSFLIFQPWWYIQTMIVTPDHLNWIDWEHKRQTYLVQHNLKRVIQLEMEAFLIFFFGNLGMRFLGLWDFFKSFKSIFSDYLNQILISISLISFILPMLFLQKGVASNTIQFLQYFLLIMGIFAGITTSHILEKIHPSATKVILAIIIVVLSIPTQIGLLNVFYSRPAFAKISQEELTALNFIKQNTPPNSIILTPPFNKYLDTHQPTPPIWAWSDTGYVSAITQRREYLADLEQVDIMGYSYQNRLQTQTLLFNETNPKTFDNTISHLGINYLYFPKLMSPKIDLSKTNLKLIYQNNDFELWRIN